MSKMQLLCDEVAGKAEVLQGNVAFAAGCVRAGIHAVDGYPGTPSTEVIDKALSQVQDRIIVGWSVNEAVSAGVGLGHSFAGRDCVVTMKIPGVYQAGDVFTSLALFTAERGALVFYIASDFTPSSTQHVTDPRPLYKSAFVPVFEPRNHQEMHEAAELAADISRKYRTAVVIMASGLLCHSEGLVRLMDKKQRSPVTLGNMRELSSLPNQARKNYDILMAQRLPAITEMVEQSPLNHHIKGSGKRGVITYGSGAMHMAEYKARFEPDVDILSLAFTNPLPMERIKAFCESIEGDVYVLEDGYRFVQEACMAAGLTVKGKAYNSNLTEWTPAAIAAWLGKSLPSAAPALSPAVAPVPRPPMICAGCPYRLIGEVLKKMRKKGEIEAIFGDIGCNTLLYFMDALDTGLAMGASESIRMGYVLSKPESAAKCVSLLGDGTECHSGMDATRNTVFRNVPGVKIVLDNEWVAMTGGQPSPSSPCNLAGNPNKFRLNEAIAAQGARVITADAYNLKDVRDKLKLALEAAANQEFVVLVIRGTCIRKVAPAAYGQKVSVDASTCKRCGSCYICPGIEQGPDKMPQWNNLCTGCVCQKPSCGEVCPANAIKVGAESCVVGEKGCGVILPEAPATITLPAINTFTRPERISLAIRGVGGQGNLFFGKVLAQVAFLAGYSDTNVLKGETHGMAQMGGPVISTFGCGAVHCPDLVPGTADCLIVMESSEVLRPGFLDLLAPGGRVLLANTHVLPQGLKAEDYPSDQAIDQVLKNFNVLKVNILDIALSLGDARGRCANVVMLGALSSLKPFNTLPESIWLKALQGTSPKPEVWKLNYAAFLAGKA